METQEVTRSIRAKVTEAENLCLLAAPFGQDFSLTCAD